MDNGDVIPSLNEDWTFGGCKLFEWLAGLTTAFLFSSFFDKPAHVMPLLVLIWIGTTLTLAMTRKKFPDEERGVRNMCMAACGFPPHGIPAPARLQPLWSGAPMRSLDPGCHFMQLGLDEVINQPREGERSR